MILWFIFVRKPNSAILMHRRIFLPQKNDNERCCKIHINNPLTFIMLFIFLWGLRVVRWVRRKQLTCPQPSLSCVMSPMSMREKGKEREYSPVLYNLSVLSWLSKILRMIFHSERKTIVFLWKVWTQCMSGRQFLLFEFTPYKYNTVITQIPEVWQSTMLDVIVHLPWPSAMSLGAQLWLD